MAPESKIASKMLALREEGAIISSDYYIPGVTVCQEKRRLRIHGRLAMAFSPGLSEL
jgi:hypothetical protein